MAKENNILEEAIIQMKNLEEAVAQNAKGILASTMKQEIKELVKESLNEQDDEDEIEDEEEMDMEDSDVADVEFPEDEEEEDTEEYSDDESMMDYSEEDDETLDLTNMDTDSVVKIFGLLDDSADIEVVPDQQKGKVHFKDNRTNKEYIVVSESDEDTSDVYSEEEMYEEDMDYEFDVEMDEPEMGDEEYDMMEMDTEYDLGIKETDSELEEIMYEIEMDDEDYSEFNEEDDFYEEEDEFVTEAKKAKGVTKGSGPKFKYDSKPNSKGFKEDMKQGTKGVGMGSAKKVNVYKETPVKGDFKIKPTKSKETKEGMMMKPKKVETKEAARTYGNGSKSGRGLRKGITPNRNLTFESVDSQELELLREKNEEYRKALNVFRTKLNEVAIFNSNLAYATRLFTEHSTSKQEKINILQRFDGVETLKESKNLYKSIKDELTTTKTSQITESIERTIEKTPSTGSAVNLIESKTYENPQFLRMKDLMSKLK